MKKNSFLVLVQDDDIVKNLSGYSNVNYVYPLNFFSVGFMKYYEVESIPLDAYIFVNKALDNNDLRALKNILDNYEFRGIIFDDLGMINLLKDKKITKILYQPHQLANYKSVNFMLKYVDSILINTDITEEEIRIILSKAEKPLCIYGLGFVSAMYSKRLLMTHYFLKHKLAPRETLNIHINDKSFTGIESSSGTIFYSEPCYLNNRFLNNPNVAYTFVNSLFLTEELIRQYIENVTVNIKTTDGFLNTKTIYKLKDGE